MCCGNHPVLAETGGEWRNIHHHVPTHGPLTTGGRRHVLQAVVDGEGGLAGLVGDHHLEGTCVFNLNRGLRAIEAGTDEARVVGELLDDVVYWGTTGW